MAVETFGERGTIVLPRNVLDAARIETGDRVRVELTNPQTLTLTPLPRTTPPDADQGAEPAAVPTPPARPANAPVDDDALPRLTLAELLERYPIEGPVDLEADREALPDEMAKDVFGERLVRFST